MLLLKRAYEPAAKQDGARYLVERLWPRGVKKEDLRIDGWMKDVAPSAGLRRWFAHDPEKWSEFRRRYFAELDKHPQSWQPIREAARRSRVTLVYSARDEKHNNALALKEYLGALRRRQANAAPQCAFANIQAVERLTRGNSRAKGTRKDRTYA